MALKRYKVIMQTRSGIETTNCEAETKEDAERLAIAGLPDRQKPATAEAEEVGTGLRRTMP